jgi:hypothetical protein
MTTDVKTEILAHDTINGIADIRFTYNDIVHEETFDLIHVVPGTEKTLKDSNAVFTKEIQLNVIAILMRWFKDHVDSGAYSPRLEGNAAPSTRPKTINQ